MSTVIAYVGKDRAFAELLQRCLLSRGFTAELSKAGGPKTFPFPNLTSDSLIKANRVFAVISRRVLGSRNFNARVFQITAELLRTMQCQVLVLMVDDAELPESLTFEGAVDFRDWQDPAVFTDGLGILLAHSGLHATLSASSLPIDLLLKNLTAMVALRTFLENLAQLYFQMERLWFYQFDQSASDARWWFAESVRKTGALEDHEGYWQREMVKTCVSGG